MLGLPLNPFFGYEITLEGLAGDLFLLRQRPETTQLKRVPLRTAVIPEFQHLPVLCHSTLPRQEVMVSFCPKPLMPK